MSDLDHLAAVAHELAAVKGIGPKSMALIDAALSVEGMTYAEAV
jgi:hypothetical protein